MSTVRTLQTGPVLGHTTSTGFRLWGRAGSTPAVGVARIREHGAAAYGPVSAFAFVGHYDGVGIVDFGRLFPEDNAGPLLPGTRYEYQIGWVAEDSIAQVEASADALVWPEPGNGDSRSGTTRTFPAEHDAGARTVFLSGSCRDPLPGGDQGESTFASIAAHIDAADKPRCDFILMTGDQIYIDHLSSRGHTPVVPIDKYWGKYRDAWGLPRFAEVLRRIPAYMMMDDHEVQNNWSRGRFDSDLEAGKLMFPWNTMVNGLRAYEAYQASVSPRIAASQFKKGGFTEEDGRARYYYDFRHGQCDFFVLDVRSDNNMLDEKQTPEPGHKPTILGDRQFDALKLWLVNGSGAIKFVVSPVPLFPDTKHRRSPADKWAAAALQREQLLNYVWENKARIPRLVFLSGDVHVSFVAELKRKGDPDDYRVYNIVSSAFNWVSPGLRNMDFEWGPLQGGSQGDDSPSYSTNKVTRLYKVNNYARISADRESVVVEFFNGHNNDRLGDKKELTFHTAGEGLGVV